MTKMPIAIALALALPAAAYAHHGWSSYDAKKVLTVNGKKTNNMMQIFLLYSKVKAQKTFEVEILRKGRPVTLRYEIVKG